MAFPCGALAAYFEPHEAAAPIRGDLLQRQLQMATRGLIAHHLTSTEFARGTLDLVFVKHVPSHTIFSRRDRRKEPYLLADLVGDLRSGGVSRLTISEATEQEIRFFAAGIGSLPTTPAPVIVEDNSSQQYLILEGNKRLAAALLADARVLLPRLEAYVGCSTLDWAEICRLHSMEPAA